MRRQHPATVVTAAALAAGLSACGAERSPTPDTATPQPPRGTEVLRVPSAGLRLQAPRTWSRSTGAAPEVLQLASGRATVTLWRYPRTEPLPRSAKQLAQARKDLLAAVRARDPTFRETSRVRRTTVDRRPGLQVTGRATVAGQPRAVRSVHVYAFGAELVVDALAEPAQAARVSREVVRPLVRSLRLTRPR